MGYFIDANQTEPLFDKDGNPYVLNEEESKVKKELEDLKDLPSDHLWIPGELGQIWFYITYGVMNTIKDWSLRVWIRDLVMNLDKRIARIVGSDQ